MENTNYTIGEITGQVQLTEDLSNYIELLFYKKESLANVLPSVIRGVIDVTPPLDEHERFSMLLDRVENNYIEFNLAMAQLKEFYLNTFINQKDIASDLKLYLDFPTRVCTAYYKDNISGCSTGRCAL